MFRSLRLTAVLLTSFTFRAFVLIVTALLFAITANDSSAQNAWTNPWHILEAGISVQFYQASNNTCTWRFWNTANSQTLQAMKFTVTYPVEKPGVAYNPYVTKTDNDVLPMPLDAGKWLGGWTAFTAPAMCRNVTLHVMDRTWGSGQTNVNGVAALVSDISQIVRDHGTISSTGRHGETRMLKQSVSARAGCSIDVQNESTGPNINMLNGEQIGVDNSTSTYHVDLSRLDPASVKVSTPRPGGAAANVSVNTQSRAEVISRDDTRYRTYSYSDPDNDSSNYNTTGFSIPLDAQDQANRLSQELARAITQCGGRS